MFVKCDLKEPEDGEHPDPDDLNELPIEKCPVCSCYFRYDREKGRMYCPHCKKYAYNVVHDWDIDVPNIEKMEIVYEDVYERALKDIDQSSRDPTDEEKYAVQEYLEMKEQTSAENIMEKYDSMLVFEDVSSPHLQVEGRIFVGLWSGPDIHDVFQFAE